MHEQYIIELLFIGYPQNITHLVGCIYARACGTE